MERIFTISDYPSVGDEPRVAHDKMGSPLFLRLYDHWKALKEEVME